MRCSTARSHGRKRVRCIRFTGTVAYGTPLALTCEWRRERFALFGLVWFLATLAPILPLKNHISAYYLTVPCLGVAMVLGVAAVRRPIWAMLPVLVYVTGSGYWARQ